MQIDDSILQKSERTILALRKLYSDYGYKYYRMSKFEEYDFYAMNKDFLVSDNVLTFTDRNGKLMALKPDVTLSIIKNSVDGEGVQKVFYSENVYRPSASDSFKEIMQTGLECFGDIGMQEVAEVITLAVKSLRALSEDCLLDISSLAVAETLFDTCGFSTDDKRALYEAVESKNKEKAQALFSKQGVMQEIADAAMDILWISDTLPVAIEKLSASPVFSDCEAVRDFLEAFVDYKSGLVDKLCEYLPIDFITYHDDWGTERDTFFGESMMESMVLEPTKRMFGHIHDLNGSLGELVPFRHRNSRCRFRHIKTDKSRV